MLAILYDIHGNLEALKAVVKDAEGRGADSYLLGGDYAMRGPQPRETVEYLRTLPNVTWLRGNTDRWLAEVTAPDVPTTTDALGALHFSRGELGEETVSELGTLRETYDRGDVLFCHASPRSDMIGFLDREMPGEAELLAGITAKTVIAGHTHIQFDRKIGDTRVINPGSVGFPFDGDQRAAYALLDDSGTFVLRRIEYPVEQTIASLQQRGERSWTEASVVQLECAAML